MSIGVKEGAVVVTKRAVDGLLRPYHEQVSNFHKGFLYGELR